MSTKKNFVFNFLLTGSNLLFPLLTFPYLSRILGANGLGICNFIISYGQNYIIIAALGVSIYGTREIAKVGDNTIKRSKLFFELLSVHLFFTLLLLAIYTASIFISADFKDYKNIALLGGSLIIFNVFSIEWLFTGVNDFKFITIRSLFIRILSIFAIFLFVKKKDDFTIYFIILICTIFFTVLVNVYHARKYISRKVILSYKGILPHLKPIFLLGIYMVLTSIYSVLPNTLLGFLSTKLAVGYYYGANRIIRMVISIFSALIAVLIPRLNLIIEEKGKEEYLLLVNKALSVVISFGVPITFLVFLLADPIVMLLAGKKFFNSIFVIQIMSPIILIVAFAQVFVLLILSVHRKDSYMVILSIIGMTISLFINIIFIPQFAEKATAVSQLAAEFLVTFVSFILARRVFKFSFPVKTFLLNVIFVLPFSIITYFSFKLLHNNFLIIVSASICCGFYFILYQLFIIKDKFIMKLSEPYLSFFNKLKML
jgi:O-antigen/teichoic acid export membrane protein